MTWILADERAVIRADAYDTADMVAWLDWFYLTYLPTRGYTTNKGNLGADIYYGTRQSWVTKIGAVMQTSQVHEFEFSSSYVSTYTWDINETDPTAGITKTTGTANVPLLYNFGTFDFQVWESDQDSNSFLVRRKGVATGSSYGSNIFALSLPYSGANNDELAAPYYWEGWFCDTLTATGLRYLHPTGRNGNVSGFVTNLVDLSANSTHVTFHTHHYASNEIFTKFNQASNTNIQLPLIFNDRTSCEAIQIVGGTDFYLDLNAGSTISILLKTGAVNPEA